MEVTIEGLVYNDTKVLEWEGASPLMPEDAGVPGLPVVLFGMGLGGGGIKHPSALSDEAGCVRFELDLSRELFLRAGEGITGAALYDGILFPFCLSPHWTFRVPVYESTAELGRIRILEDSILLYPKDNSWNTLVVREEIRIVNEGTRAFVGIRPVASMPAGLLATIRVPALPCWQTARHQGGGAPMEAVVMGQRTIGILGFIPPTGPLGEEILISYELPLDEVGSGTISRSAYCDIEVFRIAYPREGSGLEPPEGFSDPQPAPEELGPRYLVVERRNIPGGEDIAFSVSSASARGYPVPTLIVLAFLASVILAQLIARWRDAKVRAEEARGRSPDG